MGTVKGEGEEKEEVSVKYMLHENAITKLNALCNKYINDCIWVGILQRVRIMVSWESNT